MPLSREQKQWILYGSLAVGGFLAVRFGVPWLVKQFGNAARDTANAASKAAGSAAGAAVTAAPRILGTAWDEVKDFSLSDENPLKSTGESIGSWLYDLLHPDAGKQSTSVPKKAATLKGIQSVNGREYAIYSDGEIYRVEKK